VGACEDAHQIVEDQQTGSLYGRTCSPVCRVLFLGSLALASACATTESDVPVIHSRATVTPIARACIVIFQGQLGAARVERLQRALSDALQPRVSALVSLRIAGQGLNESTIRADIDAFGPDGILLIRPAGEVVHEEGGAESVTYDILVKAPKEKRDVWHANLVSESGPEVMARDLVDNLTTAGLLVRKE